MRKNLNNQNDTRRNSCIENFPTAEELNAKSLKKMPFISLSDILTELLSRADDGYFNAVFEHVEIDLEDFKFLKSKGFRVTIYNSLGSECLRIEWGKTTKNSSS